MNVTLSKSWSLNAKIAFVLSIFSAACIVTVLTGALRMRQINADMMKLTGVVVPRVTHAKTMSVLTAHIANLEKELILEKDPAVMQKDGEKLDQIETRLRGEIDSYRKIASVEEKESLDHLTASLDSWKPVSLKIRSLAQAHQEQDAFGLAVGDSRKYLQDFDQEVSKILDANESRIQQQTHSTDQFVMRSGRLLILFGLAALLAGGFLAFFILRVVNRSIGDVIHRLTTYSTDLHAAAQQAATSSQSLSQSSSEQASSLQETATTFEEVSTMVRKNSESAIKTAELSSASQAVANQGQEAVLGVVRAIEEINGSNKDIMTQIEQGNQRISEIVHVIAEIGNKTKVINDIVFQTKLLSFNASVEAARAGEHGKGFAVVAEEVGSLAQMSGNAAKEISNLLQQSIRKVEGIVADTKSNVGALIAAATAKVEMGSRIAQQCGAVLNDVVAKVTDVTRMANDIASASQEQAQGLSEINRALNQLDEVTQQNSVSSERSAEAAQKLAKQADSLREAVGILIRTVHGSSGKVSPGKVSKEPKLNPEKSTAKGPREKGQVISIRKNSAQARAPQIVRNPTQIQMKKVIGIEGIAPSEDDPRFKDI